MQPLEMDSRETPLGLEEANADDNEEESPLVDDEDGSSPHDTSKVASSDPISSKLSRRKRIKQIVFWSFTSGSQFCVFCALMIGIAILLLFGMFKPGTAGLLTMCGDEYTAGDGWESWKYQQGDLAKAEWCRPSEIEAATEYVPQCQCDNPLLKRGRTDDSYWVETLQRNKELVDSSMTEGRPLDFVIVGDSIVEHWLGTKMGEPDPHLQKQHEVYQRLFRDDDSLIHGLALGISGDKAPNVMYRLESGEMPTGFDPPLWWILVGTNDLFNSDCTVNATLAGIMQVVEHILQHQEDATVVIHSILPRGGKPLLSDSNMYWGYISQLNEQLKCFSLSNGRIQFFNATSLFLTDDMSKVNQTLMPDLLHPNEIGSIRWGEQLVLQSMGYLGKDEIPEDEYFDDVNFWHK
ncbi:hypothetical protein ACA910_016416 [Epithemia clementina (nom. ined.)]